MNIVILHGWNSNPERWQQTKRLLTNKNVGVFIPALPGFGCELSKFVSCKLEIKKAWNLGDYCDWLRAWLKEKKLGKAILLGHSFGGRVAIKFTVEHPELVERLVLIGAAGIKDKRWQSRLKRGLFKIVAKIGKRLVPGGFGDALRRGLYFLIGERDYYLAKGLLRETMKRVIEEDLEPLLSEIKSPTLIIWGENDKLTPLWMGRKIKDRIADARFRVLKEIGHNLHLESPRQLAKTIRQWLNY